MTADQRLDQLEPLISQTLAVVDRHTAQLKQLTNIVTVQSENIEFALRELLEIKQDVAGIKQDVVGIKQDVTELKDSQVATDAKVGGMDAKLDRILDLLSSK